MDGKGYECSLKISHGGRTLKEAAFFVGDSILKINSNTYNTISL